MPPQIHLVMPSADFFSFFHYHIFDVPTTPAHGSACTLGRFRTISSIHVNSAPCSGFVKKFPIISYVGQNANFTSPFWITKKYLTPWSHLRLLLDVFPFSANRIVLLLSWYIVVVGTYWPCAAKKCLVHRTCTIESLIVTSLACIELLVLSFACWIQCMMCPYLKS